MKRVILLALAAVAVAAGVFFWNGGPAAPTGYRGWVEADLLFIGPDEPGRVERVDVAEGDTVSEGQPLFAMEADIQQADLEAAEAAVEQARATLERVTAAQKRPEEIAILQAQKQRAEAAIEASRKEYERALALVERGISTNARLDQARAAYEADQAGLAEITRQIDFARLSSRSEDIQAARQGVREAEARLAQARTRLAHRSVEAKADAVVQEIYFRPGEIAPTGRPVISLLTPGNLKLRFFVPEPEIQKLSLGQRVSVTCDGCPGGLGGRIVFLAREAEFTPPVIYSLEERSKLVFRAEAVPDDASALRIGQPVGVVAEPAP
ncbi:MAG: HlyD family secretion protein [Flavobacteriaceae bacterium]